MNCIVFIKKPKLTLNLWLVALCKNNSRLPQFIKKPKLTLNLWLVALCGKITQDTMHYKN